MLTVVTIVPLVGACLGLAVLGQTSMIESAVLSAAACLAAALLALEPIRRASLNTTQIERVTMASLLTIVVRLGASFALVAAVVVGANLDPGTTMLWALGWYLLLLIAEVMLLTRYFKSLTVVKPSDVNDMDHEMKNTPASEAKPC